MFEMKFGRIASAAAIFLLSAGCILATASLVWASRHDLIAALPNALHWQTLVLAWLTLVLAPDATSRALSLRSAALRAGQFAPIA